MDADYTLADVNMTLAANESGPLNITNITAYCGPWLSDLGSWYAGTSLLYLFNLGLGGSTFMLNSVI